MNNKIGQKHPKNFWQRVGKTGFRTTTSWPPSLEIVTIDVEQYGIVKSVFSCACTVGRTLSISRFTMTHNERLFFLPYPRHIIFVDALVCGHDGQVLSQCGGDQQAIERVFVDQG